MTGKELAELQDIKSLAMSAVEEPDGEWPKWKFRLRNLLNLPIHERRTLVGMGDVIEFKSQSNNGLSDQDECKTFVDRVDEIVVDSNGRIEYWTQLYPEYPGQDSGIATDRIIKVIHRSGKPFPQIPQPKYNIGQTVKHEHPDDAKNIVSGTIKSFEFLFKNDGSCFTGYVLKEFEDYGNFYEDEIKGIQRG